MLRLLACVFLLACGSCVPGQQPAAATGRVVHVTTHMDPPRWAVLERQLLADNVPACREFFNKYFDDRGYLQVFARWGANDGPDDAFENFNRWPELHALGASDDILQMYVKGHEGLLRQYTEARTVDVPIARQGMYYKEFIVQSDWMHHGEGLQLFNRMGLSMPMDATYQQRARRFAGFYMDEDPDAPNYDPKHKIIRSLLNGSRGPMLRQATALDWVGDPFDPTGFVALHNERNFEEMLAHYEEYHDVIGDSFLNLVATALPTNAYLLTNDGKYKRWVTDYMDAWLDRMKQNIGIVPSFVDLDGKMIQVREALEQTKLFGVRFKPPKSKAGRRDVTLPDILVDALREHHKAVLELRMQLGAGRLPDDALLFANIVGKPLSPTAVSTAWADFAESIGIPAVTFHALRHTHASQLIDAGVDIVTISKRLGHAKPDITLRVYAHLFRNDDSKAAAAINAAFR